MNQKDQEDFFGIPLNKPFAVFVQIIGGFAIGVFLFSILLSGFKYAFDIFDSLGQKDIEISQLQNDQEINEFNNPSSPLISTRPDRIFIPKINVDSKVLQPDSPEIEVLDEALKEGAVHYPGSGVLEDGNIFIFGHSTNWVVVQNQAYKTFNNLDKLTAGDVIYLKGGDREYSYIVEEVTLVDENEAFVDLTGRAGILQSQLVTHLVRSKKDGLYGLDIQGRRK